MRVPSILLPCTLWDLLYLCANMRADEKEQYLLVTGQAEYDFQEAANRLWNLPGEKFMIKPPNGAPLVAGGYQPMIPGVYQSWMVGTPEAWEKHWLTITKCTLWLMDRLLQNGARRLQTNCLAKRTDAIHWYLNFLKMRQDGTFMNYTADGDSMCCFARIGG